MFKKLFIAALLCLTVQTANAQYYPAGPFPTLLDAICGTYYPKAD